MNEPRKITDKQRKESVMIDPESANYHAIRKKSPLLGVGTRVRFTGQFNLSREILTSLLNSILSSILVLREGESNLPN